MIINNESDEEQEELYGKIGTLHEIKVRPVISGKK